jgi:hypothetical protein
MLNVLVAKRVVDFLQKGVAKNNGSEIHNSLFSTCLLVIFSLIVSFALISCRGKIR